MMLEIHYFWQKHRMKIQQDHFKHFGACLIIALIASSVEAGLGALYSQSFIAGSIAGGAIGVGKEYGDHCSPVNKWDWGDIVADVAGAVFGSALGSIFSLIYQ